MPTPDIPGTPIPVTGLPQVTRPDTRTAGQTLSASVSNTLVGKREGLYEILRHYETHRDKNARTNPWIISAELVQLASYANVGALPAASGATNKCAYVGASAPYALYLSDGTSWTQKTVDVIPYQRDGTSTAGYVSVFGQLDSDYPGPSYPANNGYTVRKPLRITGGLAYGNNGIQGLANYWPAGTTTRGQAAAARLQFRTDEPNPMIRTGGYSSTCWLNINNEDGQGWRRVVDLSLLSPGNSIVNAAFRTPTAGGVGNSVWFDFTYIGGRRKRTVELPMASDILFTELYTKATSTLYDLPAAAPRIWYFTDSMGATSPDVTMSECYVPALQDFMGVRDIILLGAGGTGFVNLGPGNAYPAHITKLVEMLKIPQYANPDLVVLQASANDNNLGGIYQAVTDYLTYYATVLPTTPLIITGPTARNSAIEQANSAATETLVMNAVAAHPFKNVRFVPMMTGIQPLVRGSGTIDGPTGNGNADLMFRNTDSIHWGGAGHLIAARDFFAPRLASAIGSFLFDTRA